MRRVCGLLALAFVASGAAYGSTFDHLAEIYAQGQEVDLEGFDTEQAWAGRCVYRDAPNRLIPGLLDHYLVGDPSDPVMPATQYLTIHAYRDEAPDLFLRMSAEDALRYHQLHGRYVARDWSSVVPYRDPRMGNEHRFEWRERDAFGRIIRGADFAIRASTADNGEPFYVVRAMCAFRGGCGGYLAYGQTFQYCYVWREKLAQ